MVKYKYSEISKALKDADNAIESLKGIINKMNNVVHSGEVTFTGWYQKQPLIDRSNEKVPVEYKTPVDHCMRAFIMLELSQEFDIAFIEALSLESVDIISQLRFILNSVPAEFKRHYSMYVDNLQLIISYSTGDYSYFNKR